MAKEIEISRYCCRKILYDPCLWIKNAPNCLGRYYTCDLVHYLLFWTRAVNCYWLILQVIFYFLLEKLSKDYKAGIQVLTSKTNLILNYAKGGQRANLDHVSINQTDVTIDRSALPEFPLDSTIDVENFNKNLDNKDLKTMKQFVSIFYSCLINIIQNVKLLK